MKWFLKCLGPDYANFQGRARRKEFWYFMLFSTILFVLASVLDLMLFSASFTPIKWLLSLYMIVPNLSVMVRRLHDIGRSGAIGVWYYVLSFVWVIVLAFASVMLLVGAAGNLSSVPVGYLLLLFGGGLIFLVWGIFLLVWFCTPGTQGENKYGPDPKAE